MGINLEVVYGNVDPDWVKAPESTDNTESCTGKRLFDDEQCLSRDMQSRLDNNTVGWKPVALVNADGLARTRRYPTKRYRAEGDFLIPQAEAKDLDVNLRAFPLGNQVTSTQRPPKPLPAPKLLKRLVEATLPTWATCIKPAAQERLIHAAGRANRDEDVSKTEGALSAHRTRAVPGTRMAEVRIGPDEYHPTVRKLLQQGYTLKISQQGKPTIREWHTVPPERWGSNARKLRVDGAEIRWPDQELLFSLEWGFRDFSDATPPVCSFSPHQKRALSSEGAFHEAVQKEIDLGWISVPQPYPCSVPFRIQPGSLEDEKDGSKRLVWNASWPKPGPLDSFVRTGQGPWLPLSTNTNTEIPWEIITEWTAIESNNEMIAILAAGARFSGMKLYGRTYDLKKWFGQLAVADVELWKCGVHVSGKYREDVRMQMGRAASANSAQRVSLLLSHLIQRAAQSEKWGLKGDTGSKERRLREWINARERGCTGNEAQGRIVSLSVYQEDIRVIAVGGKAAADAEKVIPRICEGRYGIELSKKDEANKPFAQSFSAIGAAYSLENTENIVCRPMAATEQKYCTLVV